VVAEQSELSPEQQVLSEAMAIHRNEARNARLRALADSINDTARMARTTLTLALLVALYLGVTLLSSTDLNLFLNGQVVLPQVGVGVSVVQSYIFAPPVFVFLHAQALFMMTVLARKVRSYQAALDNEEIPRDRQAEYLDWLSAFAFVQLFLSERGVFNVSRLLSWLGTNVFPITLLFLIDVSFVRYQSEGLTAIHHGLLLLQVAIICAFNWRVYGGSPLMWLESMGEYKAMASRWAFNGWGPASGWVALTWVGFTQALGAIAVLFIALYAHPPKFNLETAAQDRTSIHRTSNTPGDTIRSTVPFLLAIVKGRNMLDEGPCEWWGFGCRYFDIGGETLVEETAEERFQLGLKEVSDEDVTRLRREHSVPFFAARRNFRFADFEGVFAPGINLQGADLRGSIAKPWPNDDDRADFTGANLKLASLDGADWSQALLNEAVLTGAHANGATFWNAQLNKTLFRCVNPGRFFREDRNCVRLQRMNLRDAELQGADLSGAELQRTSLIRVKLQGASLFRAQLQGADLKDAQLQGANLEDSRLQGTNLSGAQLQGAFGQPAGWKLAWMSGVTFGFAPLTDEPEGGTLSKRAEHELSTLLTNEMREQRVRRREDDVSVADHVRERVLRGVEEGSFSGGRPEAGDLVFYSTGVDLPEHERPPEGWPASPETDDPAYWLEWAAWTEDFACGSEHPARSSLRRWSGGIFGQVVGVIDDGPMKDTVREALMGAREVREDCPGLQAIPAEEWQEFVAGW
jgi:uncharacterized protein YjbI with pentapeptide repeats